jgi:hypothetical protein
MKNKNHLKSIFAFAGVIFLSASSGKAVVLIDFGNAASYRGASVVGADANGNFWNSINSGVYWSNLNDITGAATTVDFGFSGGVGGTDSYNGPAGATSNPLLASEIAATDIDSVALGLLGGAKEAAMDFYNGTNMRFEIAGLNPGQQWTLKFFGSAKWTADATTIYSIYDNSAYTGAALGTASLNIRNSSSGWLHNRDTVATLTVTPNANGAVYVNVVGSAGGRGYLNAMSVESVPEPSVASLLTLGSMALLALRRRR